MMFFFDARGNEHPFYLGLFDQLLSWRNSSRVSVARNSESLDDFR